MQCTSYTAHFQNVFEVGSRCDIGVVLYSIIFTVTMLYNPVTQAGPGRAESDSEHCQRQARIRVRAAAGIVTATRSHNAIDRPSATA